MYGWNAADWNRWKKETNSKAWVGDCWKAWVRLRSEKDCLNMVAYGADSGVGVTIGDGAVIGNSALVTKDVSPYSIVGGNPAKLIRYRFNQEQIDKLLKIRWWDWDDETIKENVDYLCNPNIDEFIDKFYK